MTSSGHGSGQGGPTLIGGRYELGELLGRGGMAEVRKGTDTRLGRRACRRELDRPVDSQQVGVLSRHAQHDHTVGARDLDVVVRDTAAEHLPRRVAVRPDARNGLGERIAHARIFSPAPS